jgi:protein O-GlcNAc transferase
MTDAVRSLLAQANISHQAGRLAEAQGLYRQVLAQEPGNADAMHYLGLLLHQLGQTASGLELLQKSVQLSRHVASYRNNLAMVLQQTGNHQEAAEQFAAAIQLKPDHAEAHCGLAASQRATGRLAEAEAAARQAVALRKKFPLAHMTLGTVLRDQGKLEESRAEFQAAALLQPSDPAVHHNLASVLLELGRFAEAELESRRAVQLSPNFAAAWLNLALTLSRLHRLDEAIQAARMAIQLEPANADAHVCLGSALCDQGQTTAGVAALRRATELRPSDPRIGSMYVYRLPFDPAADAASILREARQWDERHARKLMPASPTYHVSGELNRKLRIGYVAPTLRNHVIGLYLEPVLECHDHEAFEIVCYSDVVKPDEVTARLRQHSDLWHDTAKLNHAELADLIRRDRIDILVDLNLHMAGSRLLAFARRPAPVQIAFLGYPTTTGLSAMDYAVTDVYLDPPGSEQFYTEKLLRLPDTLWCYQPPADCPPINELPALKSGVVTFGSLNVFAKNNDAVMETCGQILAAVPDSRLAVMLDGGAAGNPSVMARLARYGISADRLLIFTSRARAQYLQIYHQIDIALDPLPYPGHTTNLDAAWMGVPMVTLPGNTTVSRAGVTVLSNLGMLELIASSREEYVEIAVRLASDLRLLSQIRGSLRERMHNCPITHARKYAKNLETLFKEAMQSSTIEGCNAGRKSVLQ